MTQLMDEHTSEHEVELVDDYAQGFTAEYSGIYSDDAFPVASWSDGDDAEDGPRVAHIVADLDEPDDQVARGMALPAASRADAPAAWFWATPQADAGREPVQPWVSPSAAGWELTLLQRFWLLRPTVFAKLAAPRVA